MRLIIQVLVLALAAVFAVAESELAHAAEIIYFYAKYDQEHTIYKNGLFWVAPGCDNILKRKCSFNEAGLPIWPVDLWPLLQ